MDELEAALLASCDRSTLVVYADALQAKGDPRGELIALDLQLDLEYSHELVVRRRELLHAWLGKAICDRPWHAASFRYGFATDFEARHIDEVEAFFASPTGRYVKKLTLLAPDDDIASGMLGIVAGEPRPWLERLDVFVTTEGTHVPKPVAEMVIAATPHLHTLGITGESAFEAFPHPAVRTLATTSPRLHLARTIPNLSAIDLLLDTEDRADNEFGSAPSILQTLFELGGVRHLDLARNEPRFPFGSPGNVDVYPFARWLSLDHVEMLRMPSLRTPSQVTLLGEMIELARHLGVTIARSYRTFGRQSTHHPRVQMPQPYWWPPNGDMRASPQTLVVDGHEVSLHELVELLEAQFTTLPPASRSAVRDFWEFIEQLSFKDDLGQPVHQPYSARAILTMVEPLDDVHVYSGKVGPWAQLAEKLRAANHHPDATVDMQRLWRW